MKKKIHNSNGFTLVEIAIVLLIVTILLGYTMAMVPVQQELKQYKQADAEMNKITEAIYAFGQVNGYLPCPARDSGGVSSAGFECRNVSGAACASGDPSADSCDAWYGFVPGKTLGIEGKYSAAGLLLDPWSKPYRYQVTNVNDATNGDTTKEDFVFQGEMANVKIKNLAPDLVVCNTDPSAGSVGNDDNSGCSAPEKIIAEAPAVILSTGKDANDRDDNTNSWIQRENLDNHVSSTNRDTVFVKTTRNDTAGAEFDDLVKWISPNILYSKMIEAGQLP